MTPSVLTSFTPFSFSISVSFGGPGPVFPENQQIQQNQHEHDRQEPEPSSNTYIPQTLVVGAFLAIFLAQVGVNFLQVVRTGRRQRRQAMELQFPQPLPQQDRTRNWESEVARGENAQEEGEGLPAAGPGPTHSG